VSIVLPLGLDSLPLAGMRLWLKADWVVGPGEIRYWYDQSGLSNFVASDNSVKPLLVQDAFNGWPVMRFSGNQWFGLTDIMRGASAGDAFAVIKPNRSGGAASGLWRLGNSGVTSYSYYPGSSSFVIEYFGSDQARSFSMPD
jgi:hypothetical protein